MTLLMTAGAFLFYNLVFRKLKGELFRQVRYLAFLYNASWDILQAAAAIALR